ncbi:MAG: hypothetical protein QM756_45160 [Polyangiaceae bacterium]
MTRPPRSFPPAAEARGCAFTLALGLLVPVGVVVFTWLSCGGLSWVTATLTLGFVLAAVGLCGRALLLVRGTKLLWLSGILVAAPLLLRAVSVGDVEGVALVTLPRASASRLLSRLYPEPDGVLLAATLISRTGRLRDPEVSRFAQILEQAYARSAPSPASVPTPAINTYLGLQGPSGFDVVTIRPPTDQADAGVIFLHGYAGNFYVYCWEFAQAAAVAKLVTLCPSLDASGAWWTQRGRQTLSATLDYAKTLGLRRLYLAGLSNGAAGASTLVRTFERQLSGLVLVSGVGESDAPAIPVLVVQGSADRMMSAPRARAYSAGRANVRYHELEGGHLIFLSQFSQVRPLIAAFLGELERGR